VLVFFAGHFDNMGRSIVLAFFPRIKFSACFFRRCAAAAFLQPARHEVIDNRLVRKHVDASQFAYRDGTNDDKLRRVSSEPQAWR